MVFILRAIAGRDRRAERYLAHDDVLETLDGDDISILTTE
jgi:hypothetical protein